MIVDILFLRYPSDVSLIVNKNSRSLFHKDVFFIHTDQGRCAFRNEKGDFFEYLPNKASFDLSDDACENLVIDSSAMRLGSSLIRIRNKNEIIKIAQHYFKPLSIQKNEIRTSVFLREDEMGFYLS